MADINNDEVADEMKKESATSGSSVSKEQIYTSVTKGNYQWLEEVAEKNQCKKSDVLRKLIQNARTRDKIEDEELII
jgi:hypothetical protein